MTVHLNASLSAEIRAATTQLPLYNGGPGVDYTHAETAYAAYVTLIHLMDDGTVATPDILLVKGRGGERNPSVWGAVSGYIDTMNDPQGVLSDALFDPVAFTARNELAEECSLAESATDVIDLRLGRPFAEPRRGGRGVVHILPLLGICRGRYKPPVKTDGTELIGHAWAPITQVLRWPDLSPGYMSHTLPRALGTIGLQLPDA